MRSPAGDCRRCAGVPRAKHLFGAESRARSQRGGGLSVLPDKLTARSDFLEVRSDVEIESEVRSGVHSRATRSVTAMEEASWWALKAHVYVSVLKKRYLDGAVD
jgi:hypothetical protein